MLSVRTAKQPRSIFSLQGRIFRTFWSVFGWANVPLWAKTLPFLYDPFLVYVLGIILATVRNHYRFSAQISRFWASLPFPVFITVIRGRLIVSTTYIPVGRYLSDHHSNRNLVDGRGGPAHPDPS